jgi:hypothetical protein
VLDGFQAGLSWITILRKREGFRAAFADFDPEKVARFGDDRPRPADGRRRHHPLERQDRRGHLRRADLSATCASAARTSASSCGTWSAASRSRTTWRGGDVPAQTPLAVDMAKAQGQGLQVLRPGDRLRLHAGHGAGQRPPDDVLPARGMQGDGEAGLRAMAKDSQATVILRRTPESAAMTANIKRAMAITAAINHLTYDDADQVRALFRRLIGREVDAGFALIPPFYTESGVHIRVGRNVFVNQNCTFYDLGGLDIGDDVMIGPNVSLITSGHPIEPSQRRDRRGRPSPSSSSATSGSRPARRSSAGSRWARTRSWRRDRWSPTGRPIQHAGRRQSGAGHSLDRGVR